MDFRKGFPKIWSSEKGLPKFMVKDTQKDFIYQLVPAYCNNSKIILKCRLKHTKCDFQATVFQERNLKLKTEYLKEVDIIDLFGNRNNLELYKLSNYKCFDVSFEHNKLCYNYLYGELVSEMLKTGKATFNFFLQQKKIYFSKINF